MARAPLYRAERQGETMKYTVVVYEQRAVTFHVEAPTADLAREIACLMPVSDAVDEGPSEIVDVMVVGSERSEPVYRVNTGAG